MSEFSRTVKPGETVRFQIKGIPTIAGLEKFIKFSSNQVKEVHAEKTVLVTTSLCLMPWKEAAALTGSKPWLSVSAFPALGLAFR